MAGKAFGKTKTVGKPVTGSGEDDILDTSSKTTNTKINGGDGNDLITGTDASDRVNAGDGDDTVRGGAGDDILFGNDGTDTAVFSGSILDYVWAWAKGNTLEVTGADGFDQLKHFEFLEFEDFTYATDGNNAPVSVLRTDATTEENTTISLDVDLYDFDGDAITVNSVSTARGTVSFVGQAATQNAAMGSSQGIQIAFDPGTDFDYLAVGQTTTETVTISFSDSQGNTSTASYDILVTGTNDAPTLSAAATNAVEDGPSVDVDLSVLGDDVDSDDDGSTLTYTVTGTPSEGSASITGTTLTFDPGADFQDLAVGETRDVTVQVTATDAHGATAVNDVTVTVTGTNDAPTLSAAATNAVEDGPSVNVDLSVLGDDVDSDDDGSTLTYTVTGTPSEGSSSITGTTLTFDPGADFQDLAVGETRDVTVQVTATDAHGATAVNDVTVTVTGTNDAPVITDNIIGQALHLEGNGYLEVEADPALRPDSWTVEAWVRTTDADGYYNRVITAPVGGGQTYSLVVRNGEGHIRFDNGVGRQVQGGDVADGEWHHMAGTYDADTNMLSLFVDGALIGTINTGPVSPITGGQPIYIGAHSPSYPTSFFDGDIADVRVWSEVRTQAEISSAMNGPITDADSEEALVLYMPMEGDTANSANYNVTNHGLIAFTNSDAPVEAAVVTEDQDLTTSGQIIAEDVDASDVLSFSVATDGAYGTTAINSATGEWTYTLNNTSPQIQALAAGETLTDSVTVEVSDGNGGTDDLTFDVTITGNNDAPVAQDDVASATAQTGLDAPVGFVLNAANGHYYRYVGGSYTQPQASAAAAAMGAHLATITSAQENAFVYSLLPGGYAWLGGSDAASEGTWMWTEGPEAGTVFWAGGVYGAAQNGMYANWQTGSEPNNSGNEDYMHMWGGGRWNDWVPFGTSGFMAEISGPSAVTGSVATNDSDIDNGAVLSFALNAPVAGLSMAADGSWSFDATDAAYASLGEGETSDVVAHYTVTDEHGATDTATLTITLTGTNDAPTLSAAATNAVEDGPSVDVDLSALGDDVDSDDDGSTLTYTVTGTPSEGSASITGTTLTFDPGADFQDLAVGETRDVTVQVTATDAHGATAVNDVTVTVTGTNDAPTLSAAATNAVEDGPSVNVDLSVLGDDVDSDDDGSTLTYTVTGTPSEGSASITGTTLTFDPGTDFQDLAVGETRDVTVQVTATDAHGATAVNDVTVTVTGTNDAPVAQALTGDVEENANTVTQSGTIPAGTYAPNAGRFYVFDVDTGVATTVLRDAGSNNTYAQMASQHLSGGNGIVLQVNPNNSGWGLASYLYDGGAESAVNAASYAFTDPDGGGIYPGSNPAYPEVVVFADANKFVQNVALTLTGIALSDGRTLDLEMQIDNLEYEVFTTDDNRVGEVTFDAVLTDPTDTVTVAAVYSDVDATDTHTISVDDTGTLGQVIDNGNGTFTYDANGAFEGLAEGQTTTDTFTYTVDDGNGGSDTQTVTITVHGENDAPGVSAIDAGSVGEDDPAVTIDLLAGQTDVDGTDVLSAQNIVITDNLGNPVVFTDNGDGTISIDPTQYDALDDGESRTLTVTYEVSDGLAAVANTATLVVDGATDNFAPVANDDNLRGSFGSGLNIVVIGTDRSDIGSTVNQLNDDTYFDFTATGYTIGAFSTSADWTTALASADAVVWGGSGYGSDGANGSSLWDALIAFNEGGGGVVTTGWGHYTLGNSPSSTAQMEQITPFDSNGYHYTYVISAIDTSHPITDGVTPFSFYNHWETTSTIDSGAISLGTFANGEQGIVALEGSGGEGNQVYLGGLYLAAPGYSQGSLRSGEADQLFEQAVAWSAGGAATDEDTPLDIAAATLLANDTDADGDVLSISAVSATSALGATVTLNLDGSINYDPTSSATLNALNDGESLQDSFTYEISDGNGGTDTATVNLSVAGVTQEAVEVVLTFNEGTNLGTYPGATTAPYQGFNFDFSGSYYANYSGFYIHEYDGADADLEASSYYAPKYLSITLATADEFEFVSAELADGFSGNYSSDANELIVRGLNDGVELFSQNVVLSDSGMEEVAFNFSGIDELTFEVIGGTGSGNGVTNTGWYTVDDMTFLV